MLVRRIKCRQCGAPLDVLPETVLLMCEYCGSFIGLDTDRMFSPEAMLEAHRKAVEALVAPSRLQARAMQVAVAMEQARREGDRRAYAALARESAAIYLATNPEWAPTDPGALRRRVNQMAKTMELTAFDPRVAQAQDEVARATAKLAHASREETLQAARKLLEANVRLYGSLLAHPEYPAEGHEDPDSLGAEATRMAVESMAGMLPKGSVERILEELFDVSREQTGHVHCENCGALVEAAEVEQSGQCPYCGGIIRVRTESAWFRQLKGTWEVTRSSTPVEQHAVAALQLLIGSYHTTGQVPSRDDAVAFLEWALPYVPREELAEALQMLSSVYGDSDPNVANLLHAIERRIQAWPCAGETPVALPRPPDHAPAELPAWPPPEEDLMASPGPSPESPGVPRGGDLSEDPWVVQSVAMWKMSAATIRADEREPSLVSFALNPFYLGGSTTVAQALEFFRQAEPGYSRERMKEYVDLLLAAHTTDPPNYFWFLQELRRALDN